jgi:zeaxanthin glucosyltransferase
VHVAFFSPPLIGHLQPLAVLAHELERRGHKATFVQRSDAAPLLERWSVALAPVPAEETGTGGPIRQMARRTDLLCRHAADLLREIGADAVVSDQLEPAGGLVAERLGLPFASVACALPVNREAGIPPPYVGWRYRAGPGGRRRNAGGWRVTDILMRPVGGVIEHWCDRWGLARRARLEACFSPLLQIAQAVPSIDFPREELPPHFHHVGPLREPDEDAWDVAGARPRVYCSLGTTARGGGAKLFRAVAGACDDLGVSLVLAHAGRLSRAEIEALPGAPDVHDFVPQRAVLRDADAVVTNCGFNTVLDALAADLPMVAMPLAFEQPAIAARIEHAGVGKALSARWPLRRRLRAGLEAVIETSELRARARLVGAELRRAGGVTRAADLIERALC